MSVDPARMDALLRLGRTTARQRLTAGVSRRSFVRGASLSAMALGAPGLLAACGTDAQTQTEESCRSTDRSAEQKVLNFANWPEYIDVDGNKMPTLEDFERTSGITVT